MITDEVRSLQAQLAAERETFTPPGGSPLSRPTAWAWYTANIALGKLHDSDRAQKKEITDLRTRLSEAEAEKQLREAAEANLAHWVKEHGIETEKRGETERELDDAVARAEKAESEVVALKSESERMREAVRLRVEKWKRENFNTSGDGGPFASEQQEAEDILALLSPAPKPQEQTAHHEDCAIVINSRHGCTCGFEKSPVKGGGE